MCKSSIETIMIIKFNVMECRTLYNLGANNFLEKLFSHFLHLRYALEI